MKKILFTITITLMSLTVIGQTNFEKRIIDEINQYRDSMNLKPAIFDTSVYDIAKQLVDYMIETDSLPPIKVMSENGELIVKPFKTMMSEKNFTESGGTVFHTQPLENDGIQKTDEVLIQRFMNFILSDRGYTVNIVLPIDPNLPLRYNIGVYCKISKGKLYSCVVLCEISS
jgi:hypothetical protein